MSMTAGSKHCGCRRNSRRSPNVLAQQVDDKSLHELAALVTRAFSDTCRVVSSEVVRRWWPSVTTISPH